MLKLIFLVGYKLMEMIDFWLGVLEEGHEKRFNMKLIQDIIIMILMMF
jgi:hypothetical protein